MTKVIAGNMSNCRFGRIVTMTLRLLSLADARCRRPGSITRSRVCMDAPMARPNSRAHRRRHRSQGSLEQGTIDIQREQVAKRYGVVSLCASAAGWVRMRCRECAAEVAVTARVCSGCGAPIVGQQPPVVADTVVADTVVADTVVAGISDAGGEGCTCRAGAAGAVCAGFGR
jgi:hypothetical protein